MDYDTRRAELKKVMLDGHECWDEEDCYCEKYSGKQIDAVMDWFVAAFDTEVKNMEGKDGEVTHTGS